MARLSPAHAVGGVAADPALTMIDGMVDPASIPDAAVPKAVTEGEPDTFYVALDRKLGEEGFAALAIRTCGGQAMLKSLPLERLYRDSRCGSLMLPWTAELCVDRLGRECLYEAGERDEALES